MVSSSQIREQLASLLAGQVDLYAFEDWFGQNTWNIHQSGSVAAEELTFAIQESLSEYSSLHISESELRDELRQILGAENRVVEIVEAPQIIYSFETSGPQKLVSVRG